MNIKLMMKYHWSYWLFEVHFLQNNIIVNKLVCVFDS